MSNTPTATLFNYSIAPTQPKTDGGLPPSIRKIVVVGGGSAGWMCAMTLAASLIPRGIEIEVLESPAVGIIGVGEGSTPWLRGFFDSLGIEEAEWMPACNATYKCGISFDNWSTKPGFASYFHPFASMLDNMTMKQFVHNANARVNGLNVHAHPNRFFISSKLNELGLAPRPERNFPFDIWYGYHFDAVLLGQFLQKKAVARGVKHTLCHIKHVQLNEKGDIASLQTDSGETVVADFFVDCSGFAALLIEKALKTPYISFKENLFNDAAVAMPTPIGDEIPPQTVSTAMRHGWTWKIPLTGRYGNGYVYSSDFCSADEAERELRGHLGLLDADVEARHLKMRTGRVTKHWNRNCLAVGLSQGFIEPLEATALMFVQRTISTFVAYFESGDIGERAREAFNDWANSTFEGTRDYIVTHYKTNSRSDTEYWRANAKNTHISDPLKQLIGTWMSGKSIVKEVSEGRLGKGYPVFSWLCLLTGVGIFPDTETLREPTQREAPYKMAQIDNLLERAAMNFRKHREVLANIPPKPTEDSLQLYFWR
jgi:hypothetical protein